MRRTVRDAGKAVDKLEGHAFKAALGRVDRIDRPVGQHRFLGVHNPVGDPARRRLRDRLASVEILDVGVPVQACRCQKLGLAGGQVRIGIAKDMQGLALGGAVPVGLVLHLRMGNKVPVVRQNPLVVLHKVLQRGVGSVAGIGQQKPVMALDHRQRIGHARVAAADQGAAVECGAKH